MRADGQTYLWILAKIGTAGVFGFRSQAVRGDRVREGGMRFWPAWTRCCVLLSCMALLGCRGGEVSTPAGDDEAKLRGVIMLYSMATQKLGRPPKSHDELLGQIPGEGDKESLLKSSRDGQKYGIVWNLDLAGRQRSYAGPVAYERVGVEGKRLIVDAMRTVQEVDAEQWKQLAFPSGYRPEGT